MTNIFKFGSILAHRNDPIHFAMLAYGASWKSGLLLLFSIIFGAKYLLSNIYGSFISLLFTHIVLAVLALRHLYRFQQLPELSCIFPATAYTH
jgi:hypothetical protein